MVVKLNGVSLLCLASRAHGISLLCPLVQSEEIKHDPEMDKSAVWAGSGCIAVFPISRSRLVSPPGTKRQNELCH